MPPSLTPELAARYLFELSADIEKVVIFDAKGQVIGGEEDFGEMGREFLAQTDGATEIEVVTPDGAVFALRSDEYSLVVICGRYVLPSLMRFDLKVVMRELSS